MRGRPPQKLDNISDEALRHFTAELERLGLTLHSPPDFPQSAVSTATPVRGASAASALHPQCSQHKDHIFAYVYGLLHQRDYCEKYADNLRLELPRIPVRSDFWALAALGTRLLELHLGWDGPSCPQNFYTLQTEQTKRRRPPKRWVRPKYRLKSENGCIRISDCLSLTNIPTEAWEYRLAGRSAIDWVLEFHKESKNMPKDPSLARMLADGKLKPYRLADCEEQLVDVLYRVINVSLATVALLSR